MSENKVKETSEKYDRPENCEKLFVPKVNPEIRGKLTHHGTMGLSAIQNMTVKVGAIIAQSTQKIMDFRGPRPCCTNKLHNQRRSSWIFEARARKVASSTSPGSSPRKPGKKGETSKKYILLMTSCLRSTCYR